MVSKTSNENENEYGSDGNTSLYSNIIDTASNTIDDDGSITMIMRKDGSSLKNKNSNNNEIRKHSITTAVVVIATIIMMLMIVVYYPGGNNDHTNNNNSIRGLADGPERNIYDPNVDNCFKLRNEDRYCWYTTDARPSGDWEDCSKLRNEDKYCWYTTYSRPSGNWDEMTDSSGCGLKCTQFAASNGGTFTCDDSNSGDKDPRCNVDYCFKHKKYDKYCWYPTYSRPYTYDDWEETTFAPSNNPGDSGCGLMCTRFAASNGGAFTCDDDDYGDNDPRCNIECIDHYDYDVDSSNGCTTLELTKPTPPRFPQNSDGNDNNLVGTVDAATESGSGGSYIGISASSSSSSLVMMMTPIAVIIVGYNTM
jgi:hypothetical protein